MEGADGVEEVEGLEGAEEVERVDGVDGAEGEEEEDGADGVEEVEELHSDQISSPDIFWPSYYFVEGLMGTFVASVVQHEETEQRFPLIEISSAFLLSSRW